MHTVVTINLNGRAYQLDDDAYEALRAYLDRAGTALQGNPDHAEILADLEQAIADKCQRYLNPPKNVVSAAEIATVLEEMGPVDAGASAPAADDGPRTAGGAAPKPRTDQSGPRRLYRIPDGAMLGGICTGLAAFSGLDVTLIRAVVFTLTAIELALSHSGIFAIIYVVLMFVLPEATTSEERAAASGTPFNAREIVDRIKRVSRDLDDGWHRDRREARHTRRQRRREWRQWRRDWRHRWGNGMQPAPGWPPYVPDYGARVFAGLALPILAFLSAATFWFGLYLVLTLLRAGSMTNWEPFGFEITAMDGVPLWVAALVVFAVFNVVMSPIHIARRGIRDTLGGPHNGWFAAWDGLLGLSFSLLIAWMAYQNIPEVRDIVEHLPDIWDNVRASFRR